MSFGWSAGDIFKAITLVGKIISCVKNVGGSRDNLQELVGELHGLEQASNDVAQLTKKSPPIPEATWLSESPLRRISTVSYYQREMLYLGHLTRWLAGWDEHQNGHHNWAVRLHSLSETVLQVQSLCEDQ